MNTAKMLMATAALLAVSPTNDAPTIPKDTMWGPPTTYSRTKSRQGSRERSPKEDLRAKRKRERQNRRRGRR